MSDNDLRPLAEDERHRLFGDGSRLQNANPWLISPEQPKGRGPVEWVRVPTIKEGTYGRIEVGGTYGKEVILRLLDRAKTPTNGGNFSKAEVTSMVATLSAIAQAME